MSRWTWEGLVEKRFGVSSGRAVLSIDLAVIVLHFPAKSGPVQGEWLPLKLLNFRVADVPPQMYCRHWYQEAPNIKCTRTQVRAPGPLPT